MQRILLHLIQPSNVTTNDCLAESSNLTLSNMRWFTFKALQPVISESKEINLDDFYHRCPHCDGPCPGDPMCSSCHVKQIYTEEYTETFGCHCWENGPDFVHNCTADPYPTLTYPNWISPAEKRQRLSERTPFVEVVPSKSDSSLADLQLPPEILSKIFDHLDEITIVNASRVSRRWEFVIMSHYEDELWKDLLLQRWPLFKPFQDIQTWLPAYFHMMNSIACKTCFLNATGDAPIPNFNGQEGASREIRLEKEVIGLSMAKPVGIDAIPIDSAKYNWIARIEGPTRSPYQGGVFYIKLTFPRNYPYQPPICNMMTKIIHPCISRHGRIGLSVLKKRVWTPCSTVRSILIAIYTLLSSPQSSMQNGSTCLESTIGDLCSQNFPKFCELAKDWTKKFAMHYEC